MPDVQLRIFDATFQPPTRNAHVGVKSVRAAASVERGCRIFEAGDAKRGCARQPVGSLTLALSPRFWRFPMTVPAMAVIMDLRFLGRHWIVLRGLVGRVVGKRGGEAWVVGPAAKAAPPNPLSPGDTNRHFLDRRLGPPAAGRTRCLSSYESSNESIYQTGPESTRDAHASLHSGSGLDRQRTKRVDHRAGNPQ